MLRPEPTDIILIIVVALLLFGPKRIPEVARAFGSSIREFRDGMAGKADTPGDKPAQKGSDQT
jgi:sec-independent protein translocase protein TatA